MEISLALNITNPLCSMILMMMMALEWNAINVEWQNLAGNWEDLG